MTKKINFRYIKNKIRRDLLDWALCNEEVTESASFSASSSVHVKKAKKKNCQQNRKKISWNMLCTLIILIAYSLCKQYGI